MYEFRGNILPTLMTMPRMGQEALPCVRDGEAIYVDGKQVRRDPEKFIAYTAVTPLTGRDLLILPEGDRFTEQLNLFQPLGEDIVPLEVEDKVLRDGKAYQVQDSKLWGSFVQARISRIDVGPESIEWPNPST